jgi:hypothetical protein
MQNEKFSWWHGVSTLVLAIILIYGALEKHESGEHTRAIVLSFLAGFDFALSFILFAVAKIFNGKE